MRAYGRTSPSLALLASLALLSCGDDNQPTDPGPTGPTVTTSVNVVDNDFDPGGNAVSVGQTVTWTWQGNNQHNVTFDDAGIGNSATKNSGTFNATFDTAGDFTYFCTVHGRAIMSGRVTVNP